LSAAHTLSLHDALPIYTRMSFGDHIEDLRTHLFRALKGLAVGMIFGFWPLGPYVLDIINAPVVQELNRFESNKLEREIVKNRERSEEHTSELQSRVDIV